MVPGRITPSSPLTNSGPADLLGPCWGGGGMALGRQKEWQADLMVGWAELPRSPGTPSTTGCRRSWSRPGSTASPRCAPTTSPAWPAIDPAATSACTWSVEGIDSERGLEWRCSDSLVPARVPAARHTEPVPDHSWLSKTPPAPAAGGAWAVFAWVLERLTEHGLIKGGRIGVDAQHGSQRRLGAIVRRDTGEGYRAMLERLAKASGMATPTATDLVRLDRTRKGKRLSNAEWASPADPRPGSPS